MKYKLEVVKILCGVLVGGLLFGVGAPLMADTTSTAGNESNTAAQTQQGPPPGGRHHDGQGPDDLTSLVKSGTIDQATADKLKTYMEEKFVKNEDQQPADGHDRPDMLADAVTGGVITEAQSDAIKTAMQKTRGQGLERRQPGSEWFSLVDNGVIDQATADALKTFMDKQRPEPKEEPPMEAEPTEGHDIWTAAAADGIITQTQASAIRSALQQAREKAQAERAASEQERVAKAISTLVNESVITQVQADKVTAFLKAQDAARESEAAKYKMMTQEERETERLEKLAEMEKIKAMTDEARKAYMQQKQANLKSPLSDLVTDGTLTQDQAAALEKVLLVHRGPGPRPGM